MPKPALATIPVFYHKYVALVQQENVVEALETNTQETIAFFDEMPEEKWAFRYAEGKWSVKEMLQHIIDAERIFSYRALCFARGEKESLPGFDENTYAASSDADRRQPKELMEEYGAVRRSTLLLFRSFSAEQLDRTGVANNNPVSVNGIGFITVGHVAHHLNILKERYLKAD